MDLLRFYLLAGLIVHKAVWEVLKRHDRPPRKRVPPSLKRTVVKGAKVAILIGIVLQTVVPFEVLPLAGDSGPLRIAGAVLFTLGLAVALLGRIQLGKNWSDIEAAEVHGTQALVCHGIYRYIRHPIYAGDLALLLGVEIALNSWLVFAVAVLALAVFRKTVSEEAMLVRKLAGYDAYCRRTKRFVPFVL
jgi:protein-S-isoprenylcysteine O-methyltransferase Ste14